MTFRSADFPEPVRTVEGEFYNDLWFEDRPVMQVFSFMIDKDWRFVMTANGEIDTKFEVYVTVTTMGEAPLSYSTDQVFSLYAETVTFTREQPLEERYKPPVVVEIKVFLERPMEWIIKIDK